jgi:chromodomain-helicase-DNA-binding protein 1
MQEEDEEWPKGLSRKDATAYVRAVKRYGLEQRLPEIAAEVGPSLEAAPDSAQCAPLSHFPV